MRKKYVKPEILVEEILVETMIATSPGDQTEVTPGMGPEGKWSNDRRGSWGDLWD